MTDTLLYIQVSDRAGREGHVLVCFHETRLVHKITLDQRLTADHISQFIALWEKLGHVHLKFGLTAGLHFVEIL